MLDFNLFHVTAAFIVCYVDQLSLPKSHYWNCLA